MVRTSATGVQTRVVSRRAADGSAVPFNVLISCSAPTGGQIDITSNLVAAVAHALWEARGGDPIANWVDAESVVAGLISPAATLAQPSIRASAPIPEPKPRAGGKPAAAGAKTAAGGGKPDPNGAKRSSRR